eukprot:jgi/Chrzof1/13741/Cz08g10110.t1
MATENGSSQGHILLTGGLGFIGSHTALVLAEQGYEVTMLDNLSNSFLKVLDAIKKLAGDKADQLHFAQADIRDKAALDKLFTDNKFDAVIHFAAFKAVGESSAKPLEYYDNNFGGSVSLMQVMRDHGCKNIVFSSSATVYGIPDKVPVTEDFKLNAINPYGRTKLFQEEMFRDVANSDKEWRIMLLRYFNPVAAHPSGDLGEHPVGVPNNLMPFVQQVALGQREFLRVFGDDYDTPDGTGIRDYIHIMDLAEGHVAALKTIMNTPDMGCKAINLGTGKGTSVLEMVKTFERVSGAKVPYQIVERRPGDAAAVWADTSLAEKEIGWKAKYDLEDMCRHQWQWASKHPKGYDD